MVGNFPQVSNFNRTELFISQNSTGSSVTTLNMILYLVLLINWNTAMLYLFTIYLTFYQQVVNQLFGHYKTLTTLLGKKLHQW